MVPSLHYLALLDIKAVLRKWQDLDVSDTAAVEQIRMILAYLKR